MGTIAEPPRIGDVLFVALPQQTPSGHEQIGHRPAVVIGIPERLGRQRYPMLIVVPMTTQFGSWAGRAPDLYPLLVAGTGGLRFDSIALLDHLRGIDVRRVTRRLGRLDVDNHRSILRGLEHMSAPESRSDGPEADAH